MLHIVSRTVGPDKDKNYDTYGVIFKVSSGKRIKKRTENSLRMKKNFKNFVNI
jgi:hypothetical protein